MIQIAIFVILMIYIIVKVIKHFLEKSRRPKNAEQQLQDTVKEALESNSAVLMESVADILATGKFEYAEGNYDNAIPQNFPEAERWYAMTLEEQLTLRVEQDIADGSFSLYPFEKAVLRYCGEGPLPRDLNKAMSVARYLVRRNVAIGGVLVQYVRELMAGQESTFYKASGPGGWTHQLQVFAEERARLQQEKEKSLQQMRLHTGTLSLVMEHEGVTNLPGRIAWILDMAGWPAPGAAPKGKLPGGFARALEAERQGNAQKAAAQYRRLSSPQAKYRLGQLYRRAVSFYEGDKPWQKGTGYLRQAAAKGYAMAAYELGETPSVADIAALAGTGDLEAIEALGCMLQQGRGGAANPLMAQMVWQEGVCLLRKAGDPTEGWQQDALSRLYRLQGDEENAFRWLAIAGEKSKYPPAMYRLCLRPEIRLSTSYVAETLDDARRAGFPKGKYAYILNRWERDEHIHAETLTSREHGAKTVKSQAQYLEMSRVARKTKIIMEPELITQCPDLAAQYDQTLSEIIAKEKARSNSWAAQQQVSQARDNTATAKAEPDLRADELPYFIFDEWSRSWEKDCVIPGKYNLSAEYSADSYDISMGFAHFFSNIGGDQVIIRDEDISGGQAKTGGHEFHW